MSTRERWTVYPLLFLTLGIALKDKVTRQLTTDRIECRTLLVKDREGQTRVILAPTDNGGIVEAHATRPGMLNVVMGQADVQAGLMFTDAESKIIRSFAIPIRRPARQAPSDAGESPRDAPQERPSAPSDPPADGASEDSS